MLLQNPPAEDEAQPTNYVGLQPSYAATSLTQPPSHLPGTPGRPPEPLCGQTVAVATPGSPIARAPAAGLFCSCAGHPCTMRTTATRAAREANQHPRPTRQTPRMAPSPVVWAACASAAENRGRRRLQATQMSKHTAVWKPWGRATHRPAARRLQQPWRSQRRQVKVRRRPPSGVSAWRGGC